MCLEHSLAGDASLIQSCTVGSAACAVSPLAQYGRETGIPQCFDIPAFAGLGKYLQILNLASELREEGKRGALQNEFRCESMQVL